MFATYCPVALAAIGELPSTLADRAVPIRMERKAPGDVVQKLRTGRNRADLADLARMFARWARDNRTSLPTDPVLPDALNDREGDISVPLLAIAEHAGPAWSARARAALLGVFGLRAANDDNLETGALLLADLRLLFAGTSSVSMASAELCARLGEMDDRPWPEWRAGKPITARQLAVALRPFGIRPTTIRIGNQTPKGYPKEAFAEAWERYTPAATTPLSDSKGGSEPQHRNNEAKSNNYYQTTRNSRNRVATRKSGKL